MVCLVWRALTLCRGHRCLSLSLFPHGCLLPGLAPTLAAAVFFLNFYPLPFPLTPNFTHNTKIEMIYKNSFNIKE